MFSDMNTSGKHLVRHTYNLQECRYLVKGYFLLYLPRFMRGIQSNECLKSLDGPSQSV